MKRNILFTSFLAFVLISGCTQAVAVPTQSADMPQPSPTVLLPTATSEAAMPTATSEALIPAEWMTYTSPVCEYTISYPPKMGVSEQTRYSHTFQFMLANPDEGARNFLYVSEITPEIEEMVNAGTYDSGVYNYDTVATANLQSMQVGESKSAHANLETGFTYQRLPDTMIGDQNAQTYENVQPWEFPPGTKEIRYYASLNGCTYLIGGYMDTTGSNLPGTITEDLFHQIIATIRYPK